MKLPAPPEKDCVLMPMVRQSAPALNVSLFQSSFDTVPFALHEYGHAASDRWRRTRSSQSPARAGISALRAAAR